MLEREKSGCGERLLADELAIGVEVEGGDLERRGSSANGEVCVEVSTVTTGRSICGCSDVLRLAPLGAEPSDGSPEFEYGSTAG